MELFEALEKFRHAEFSYGTADCCLFVADVLLLTTGHDYARPWRGKYRSESGALRLVAKAGGVDKIATEAFGPMRPPLLMRRGSPVLIGAPWAEADAIGKALGICDGAGIVYLTAKGLARAPLSAAEGCFNV